MTGSLLLPAKLAGHGSSSILEPKPGCLSRATYQAFIADAAAWFEPLISCAIGLTAGIALGE